MRIILDYSWNHTGITFPAWKDVLAKQAASRFADWYVIERFDDPVTPDTNAIPLSRVAGGARGCRSGRRSAGRREGTTARSRATVLPPVLDNEKRVTKRWLDPNSDGDLSDGIDGFRLDVAEMVPLGFWRDYRRFVRSINPNAYLVGEVWWEKWPDKIWDPAPWLQGDVFDAVMNYRWYMPPKLLAHTPPRLKASGYAASLDSLNVGIGWRSSGR